MSAIAVAAAAVAGCAAFPTGQASQTSTVTQPTKLQRAQATHEYPSAPPPADRVNATAPADPAAAVRIFATEYINWSAATVTAHMQALAATSIGQARSAMTLAAAQTAGDYELKRGGIANAGTVEAVAPLTGHRDEYVVVTREQTTASNTTAYQGLRPAWHVAVAVATQIAPGQWVVSRWQPES